MHLRQLPAPPGGRRPGLLLEPHLSHLTPPTRLVSVRSCWPLRRFGKNPPGGEARFLPGPGLPYCSARPALTVPKRPRSSSTVAPPPAAARAGHTGRLTCRGRLGSRLHATVLAAGLGWGRGLARPLPRSTSPGSASTPLGHTPSRRGPARTSRSRLSGANICSALWPRLANRWPRLRPRRLAMTDPTKRRRPQMVGS